MGVLKEASEDLGIPYAKKLLNYKVSKAFKGKLTKNKMNLTRAGDSWALKVGEDLSTHQTQPPTQGGTLC